MGYSGQGHANCRLGVVMCQCRLFSIRHLTNSVDQNTSYKSYQSLSLLRNSRLLIGPEYLFFQLAVQKCTVQNINKYNFACCSIWVRNLVSHIEGIAWDEEMRGAAVG